MQNFRLYTGTFLTALSVLMYEILLSRVFSVTMGYHYAFLAVSVAMFGLTAGGITVYLYKERFLGETKISKIIQYTFYFAMSVPVSFILHLYIPFRPEISVSGFFIILFTFILISVPFFFAGVVICILLTGFLKNVNRIYASDLTGSAIGCMLLVLLLEISGAVNSVMFISAFIFLALIFFSLLSYRKKNLITGIIGFVILIIFSIFHTSLYNAGSQIIDLKWVRGAKEEKPLYERWNSFSRVTVSGDSTMPVVPFGWGLSNTYDRNKKIKELMLNVDANSTTVFTGFNGDLSQIEYLKYDVSNVCHYLRTGADVMVIGSGGGRDILTSLLFNQRKVIALEMNHEMINALNGTFGDFTGHLDRYDNVSFIQDEARSFLQRDDKNKYDIIQISVIDNLAATASGAFVLTESPIYTIESWKLFISRLNPGGIMTVTRFWMKNSAEIYRLAAISADALREMGVGDPSQNIIILRAKPKDKIREAYFNGVANIIIGRDKLSDNDLKIADSVANVMEFEIVKRPGWSSDNIFDSITSGKDASVFLNNFPINIKPPTDDKPFFFHLLKISDIFDVEFWKEWDLEFNAKAIFILLSLFGVTVILSGIFIIIPLFAVRRKLPSVSYRYLLFFASIGLGFMLVEISMIQTLHIYLGHPTYSLTVTLFTLLLSAGTGSYFMEKFAKRGRLKVMFILLLLTLIISARVLLPLTEFLNDLSTAYRIIISVIIIFPVGFFLGMAFPAGLLMASVKYQDAAPWLWGVNGAFSVCASVLAVILSMSIGISWTYWTGVFIYLAAVISVWRNT